MKIILDDIIGREKEIKDIKLILEESSVVVSSTRRMGKTMILTKMNETVESGVQTMLCFIESVQSAEEFVNVLREKLIEQGLLTDNDFKKVTNWLNTTLKNKDFGFFKTPDFSRHWKTILNLIFDDLVEKHNTQLIIMLDEFPKMLWNLIQIGKHQQAEEILDELRSIRERHERRSKLRFIYCGSIGVNLVISNLVKQFHYAGAPLNNMHTYLVEEMGEDDANLLIRHLMEKYNFKFEDEYINHLASICSFLPFFIDRIFMQIRLSINGSSVNKAFLDKAIDDFIEGREQNNQFNHFTERIDVYYKPEEKRIAHEILRILCKSDEIIPTEKLLNLVKSKVVADDYEISKILSDLYQDMYVDRVNENDSIGYQFRFNLLKKWWRLNFA